MDRYRWTAYYNDGSSVNQIDPDGTKHLYDDLDRDKLVAFELLSDEGRALRINTPKGERFLWRRRVSKLPNGQQITVHLVAVKGGVIGLFDDGHIEVAPDFGAEDLEWAYPIVETEKGT